jgi:hypothetical protein
LFDFGRVEARQVSLLVRLESVTVLDIGRKRKVKMEIFLDERKCGWYIWLKQADVVRPNQPFSYRYCVVVL